MVACPLSPAIALRCSIGTTAGRPTNQPCPAALAAAPEWFPGLVARRVPQECTAPPSRGQFLALIKLFIDFYDNKVPAELND